MVGDGYHLSFADGSFDVVYAHQILQHTSDPVAVLSDMRRVLRTGGLLAVREADYGAFTWSPADERLSDGWTSTTSSPERTTPKPTRGATSSLGARGRYSVRRGASSNWTYQPPADRIWWGGLWADRMRESEFARQVSSTG